MTWREEDGVTEEGNERVHRKVVAKSAREYRQRRNTSPCRWSATVLGMRPGTGIGGQEGEERKGKITYWFPDWRVQTVPRFSASWSGQLLQMDGVREEGWAPGGPMASPGNGAREGGPWSTLSFLSFFLLLVVLVFSNNAFSAWLPSAEATLLLTLSLRIFSSFIAHFNSRTIYIHVHVCVLDFFFQFHCIIFSCFLEIWRHSLKYHFKFFAREYNYFFRINHKEIVFFC